MMTEMEVSLAAIKRLARRAIAKTRTPRVMLPVPLPSSDGSPRAPLMMKALGTSGGNGPATRDPQSKSGTRTRTCTACVDLVVIARSQSGTPLMNLRVVTQKRHPEAMLHDPGKLRLTGDQVATVIAMTVMRRCDLVKLLPSGHLPQSGSPQHRSGARQTVSPTTALMRAQTSRHRMMTVTTMESGKGLGELLRQSATRSRVRRRLARMTLWR